MKKANKFSKGKTIGIVAASLAAVSLIGVGFSTWIINTKNTETTGDISVTVADTKDISIKIDNVSVTDATVVFDADEAKMNAVTGHLLSCSKGDKEDLSFTISYDVTVGVDAESWQIMAAIDDSANGTGGKFKTAVETRKYISLPTTLGITTGVECLNQSSVTGTGLTVNEKTTTDTTKKAYTVSQTFTFSWGLAFAKKNPVEVTASDKIYANNATDGTTTTAATIDNLTVNTKAMKNLELSKFNVILSVGTVN